MGRVDEAMRRAAEAGGHAAATVAETAAVEADAFPAEAPDRPKLRSVGVSAPVAPMPKPSGLLPPLSTRLSAGLSRKVVVDQDIDPVSKEQYRRLATT